MTDWMAMTYCHHHRRILDTTWQMRTIWVCPRVPIGPLPHGTIHWSTYFFPIKNVTIVMVFLNIICFLKFLILFLNINTNLYKFVVYPICPYFQTKPHGIRGNWAMISIAKAGEPSCSLQTVLCGLVAHNARLSKMGKSQSCGLKSEVP